MKSDWVIKKISDISRVNENTYSPKENWPFVDYLDTGNITENVINSIQRINPATEKLPSRARRKVMQNSIIYSTVRPNQRHFGIMKDTSDYLLVSTGFAVIDVNTLLADADFLYFYLSQPDVVEHLHSIAEQSVSAYPSIKVSDIEDLEIQLPPLPIQRNISAVLRALDEKIALNRRINDNLVQMAQAIFLNYYSRSCVAIPFTSIIDVLGGGTPKTTNPIFWNGDIPFFTPKDVGNPYTLHTEKYISGAGLEHCNSRLYPINTVFVTARGTVGKVSLAGFPMAMNQSCYALVGKGVESILVYFYALQTVQNLRHKASGAVFDAIVTRDFESESIQQLTPEDSASFCETAKPIFKAIHNNSIENLRLVSLRDTLLPRLMSGELDVSGLDL